ncbi:hypothetical protein KI387_021913, partial [Taxus chinensis]
TCIKIEFRVGVSEVVEIYVVEMGAVGIDVKVSDVDAIGVFDEGLDVIDWDVMITCIVEMIVDIGGVDVVVGVFDVDVGEGTNVRDVGIGVYINGAKINAKDEFIVIDWGMIEADEVGGIIKVDVYVLRVGEGIGIGKV